LMRFASRTIQNGLNRQMRSTCTSESPPKFEPYIAKARISRGCFCIRGPTRYSATWAPRTGLSNPSITGPRKCEVTFRWYWKENQGRTTSDRTTANQSWTTHERLRRTGWRSVSRESRDRASSGEPSDRTPLTGRASRRPELGQCGSATLFRSGMSTYQVSQSASTCPATGATEIQQEKTMRLEVKIVP
jgi:hypothetical protein